MRVWAEVPLQGKVAILLLAQERAPDDGIFPPREGLARPRGHRPVMSFVESIFFAFVKVTKGKDVLTAAISAQRNMESIA